MHYRAHVQNEWAPPLLIAINHLSTNRSTNWRQYVNISIFTWPSWKWRQTRDKQKVAFKQTNNRINYTHNKDSCYISCLYKLSVEQTEHRFKIKVNKR